MSRFEQAVEVIFQVEGGYSDHPDDHPTNWGITDFTLSAWLGREATKEEVKNLDKDTALKIYKEWYWDKVSADQLPPGVDLVVFDGAVNSGPEKSIKLLQHALGVATDGVIGPITLWEVSQADSKEIISKIVDIRLAWLQTLPKWSVFGRGWTNRLSKVEAEAIKMVVNPSPSTRKVQDPRLIRAYKLAKTYIGLKEVPGVESNPQIDQWFSEWGYAYNDSTAWCALFLGQILEYADIESTRKLNARSYLQWGEPTNNPQEGDVVVFWRNDKNGWQGHNGFVVKIDKPNNRILVLGANQDNMVNEKWYPIESRSIGVLEYRTLTVTQENEMPDLINQPSNMPTRKVTAFAGAGVAAALVAEPLFNFLPFLNELVDAETPEQFTTALFALAIGAVAAWFTRDRA